MILNHFIYMIFCLVYLQELKTPGQKLNCLGFSDNVCLQVVSTRDDAVLQVMFATDSKQDWTDLCCLYDILEPNVLT